MSPTIESFEAVGLEIKTDLPQDAFDAPVTVNTSTTATRQELDRLGRIAIERHPGALRTLAE